jgi:hypothetical protein
MEEEAYLAEANMRPGKYLIFFLLFTLPDYILSTAICGKDVQEYLQWGYLSVSNIRPRCMRRLNGIEWDLSVLIAQKFRLHFFYIILSVVFSLKLICLPDAVCFRAIHNQIQQFPGYVYSLSRNEWDTWKQNQAELTCG